jgi:phage terminase Nu1 subunit (DNA packaging protein)
LGEIVGKKRLSAILGYSERSVTGWTQAGMPVHKVGGRGKENQYDTAEVVTWLLSRETSGGDSETIAARRRIACAEAGRREIRLARERGEVAPLVLVQQSVEQVFTAFRSRLLRLPRTAVPRLRASKGEAGREKVLRELVYEALTELSAFDFGGLVRAAARELGYDGPPSEKPAESNPQPGEKPKRRK